MQEAQKSGVAEIVDHKVPSEDEIDLEMQLLAKQQEKLLNELKKSYQEEAERSREHEADAKREEMEKRLRALNLNFSPENEKEMDELKSVFAFFLLLFSSLIFFLADF